jgi:glycosyltransferase involved in cell wall biosynthesis
MRVIHVAPTPFGDAGLFGGGERYPLELARSMAGHVDCELITFGPRSRVVRESTGLTVRVLRTVATLFGHPAHPLAAGLPRALRDADIVHTHHLRSTPSRIAALTARRPRQQLVTTDHGLGGGDWLGLLPRLFDGFLTVSEYSARTLRAPPDRTRVVYGGADPHRFSPGRATDRHGVLFVGRLTPHKGIDRLIRALPAGATLTVAGSASRGGRSPEAGYPALLSRLAADRAVRFTGPAPDRDLPALYRGAAVLAFPSVETTCYGRQVAVSELLGLSVLEAMASGLPVVASRLGGVPEIVADGETGFLVEPGDVDELHDRLAQLLGQPALAERMGRRAREQVVERFSWEHCVQRCLAAYRELQSAAQGQATGAR